MITSKMHLVVLALAVALLMLGLLLFQMFRPTFSPEGAIVNPRRSCSNGICDRGETCSNCAIDCGACPTIRILNPVPSCSNGICDRGETCSNCAIDCGACPGDAGNTKGIGGGAGIGGGGAQLDTYSLYGCPNGICDRGETCSICPSDCGACPASSRRNITPPRR